MSIHFSNFAVGKGGNSPTSTTNIKKIYDMQRIELIGNYPKKWEDFQENIKELRNEWENNYWYIVHNDPKDQIRVEVLHKKGYESRYMLSMDAMTIADYLEKWSEFEVSKIILS